MIYGIIYTKFDINIIYNLFNIKYNMPDNFLIKM